LEEMNFDPTSEHSHKTKRRMPIFEDGDVKMWCEWRKWHAQFDELVRLVPLWSSQQKQKIVLSLLPGKALDSHETAAAKATQEQHTTLAAEGAPNVEDGVGEGKVLANASDMPTQTLFLGSTLTITKCSA
jgi:hypothetical protein